MSEAERITDWGDYLNDEFNKEEVYSIIENKLDRLKKLRGKYVIVADGRSGRLVYLQDRSISMERWWTYYLDCAMGFVSYEKCSKCLSRYKYNNPRLVRVSDLLIRDEEHKVWSLLGNFIQT